jgi:hypothetical protein
VKQILKRLSYPHDIGSEVNQIIKKDFDVNGKLFKELGIGVYKKN